MNILTTIRYPDAWMIGQLRLPQIDLTMPISERDQKADSSWAGGVVDAFNLSRGETIHLIGDGQDGWKSWMFESALIARGIPFSAAEGAIWDVARTEMFLRRLKPKAVVGMNGGIVEALLSAGHDLKYLLESSRVILCDSAAARILKPLGLLAARMAWFGPVLGVEWPGEQGFRYNHREWKLEAIRGELLVTALMPRAFPVVRLSVGTYGQIEVIQADHRVVLESA